MYESDFNRSENRFGSASWAQEDDLRRAGLFSSSGLHLGFWGKRRLRLESDAPAILFGGSGAGKTRDYLGFVCCDSPGVPALILDPRGELGAISFRAHALHNEAAWFWNPMGIGAWLPKHQSVNPLDILDIGAPTFHADAKFIAEGLVTMTSGEGRYFDQRARDLIEALMKSAVERFGSVSFPKLAHIINTIEGDPNAWADHLEAMLASRFDDVRRTASEALVKQQDSPREWGSIMGSLYANMGWASDPALLASLKGGDFSFKALVDPHRVSKIFLNVPAEYLQIWSPILRVMFTTAMLYKARAPQARRVLLVVDEAGQLGKAEFILRGFTFARGAGVRMLALFQDAGQVVAHYGEAGLQTLIGSAQTRIWFGIRDSRTAELVSRMAGTETLAYDDYLAQDDAQRRRSEMAQRVLQGENPFTLASEYAQYARASEHRTKQARPLLALDEALAMREDRALVFISGKNLRPAMVGKLPYFASERAMAGKYLPNPYHPPLDSVPVVGRFGSRRARVTWGRVPAKYAHLPQHRDGRWPMIDGFPD
ncbi:MAG: type IV secretory system conjugative DNA transfer family protein [Pseudomonadota bacterium]